MLLKRFLFFVMIAFLSGTASAQNIEAEANLKAVFIYNFTKYVEWDTNNGDFVIGVIGQSSVTSALNIIARNNTVKNKKIVIKVFNKPEDIEYCNILFIPKNSFSLSSILEKTGKGTLTVSEENGYAKKGTAFNFVIVNNKLKFEANLKALYLADLKAGSQLLKLGIIVD
ncbi:MAG: YfiR family protein [Bacteroidota bacterium]